MQEPDGANVIKQNRAAFKIICTLSKLLFVANARFAILSWLKIIARKSQPEIKRMGR